MKAIDEAFAYLFNLTEELAIAEADLKYFYGQCELFEEKDLDKFAKSYEGYIEAESRVLVLRGKVETALWMLDLQNETVKNETV
jgi:hypothetical protein